MKKKVNYLHNNVKKDERKVEDGIKWNWKKKSFVPKCEYEYKWKYCTYLKTSPKTFIFCSAFNPFK